MVRGCYVAAAVELLGRIPVHTLLLAAYAVLFVYADNIDEILPSELAGPLGQALIASAVVLAIAALLYRDARRGAIVATAIVGTAAFFGHLTPLVDELGLGDAWQLAIWAVIIVLAGVYAALARGSLSAVTAALNGFGLVLVLLTLITIVPFESSRVLRASQGEAVVLPAIASASTVPDRDIYFLVFDRYGSDWSIDQRFGITNDLGPDLEAAGFQVIPGARANYRATDFSLATMLSMRMLNDLTVSVGPDSSDRTPARERLARHDVGQFLRANGYRYYHLGAWYEPTRTNAIADEALRWGRTTEFEAVLLDATILPVLERVLGSAPEDNDFRDRHRNEALFQFRQVERLAGEPGRKFVFSHFLLPHPPYGFNADGSIVLEEEERNTPEEELYEEQLRFTNDKIRHMVEVLLDRPEEEQPIIVLTGDEGPFVCFNQDCIDGSPETYGIRFGTFRAYNLPGIDYEIPADDSGVNIFRTIFREYFGADLPALPNRSYDWPDNDHLYDFFDVTDQLPLPGAAATEGPAASLQPR
jgi:hypothetical protein